MLQVVSLCIGQRMFFSGFIRLGVVFGFFLGMLHVQGYAQVVVAFQGGEGSAADTWSYTGSGANNEAINEALSPLNKRTGSTSMVAGGLNNTAGSCFAGGTGNSAPINNQFTFESIDLSAYVGQPKTLQFWYGNRLPNCNGPGWDNGENLIFQPVINGVVQAGQTLVAGGGDISLGVSSTSFTYAVPECALSFGFILQISLNRRDEVLFLDDVLLTSEGFAEQVLLEAGAGGSVCPGSPFALLGTVEGNLSNVSWSGGAGTFADSGNPETTYTPAVGESGVITLQLSAEDVCSNVLSAEVQLVVDGELPQPFITSSAGGAICPGELSTLTAFGGQDYLWSTGEIGEDIFVDQPGVYSVEVSNECGIASANITLLPNDDIAATQQLSICAGGTALLPDGTVVAAPGVYQSTVSAGGNGCDTLYTTTVIVEDNVSATQQLSICAGGTALLPDGSMVAAPGVYQTTVSAGGSGCDTLYTTTVIVEELTATQQLSICTGATALLPDGTAVSAPGVYQSTVSAGGNGCDTLYTTTVIVEDNISATQQLSICAGGTALLPDGSVVDGPGVYQTTVSAGGNGCDTLYTSTVVVNDPITASEAVITCNFVEETYTVQLDLLGGEAATYEAMGISGTFAGNVFTGGPIPAGGAYNFSISDGNGCETLSFSGSADCVCYAAAELSGNAQICEGEATDLLILLEGTAPFEVSYSNGVQTFGLVTTDALVNQSVSPLAGTTYTLVSVSDALCAGVISGSAFVEVLPLPTAGGSGAASLCDSDEPVNLSTFLQGNPDPDGTWSSGGNSLPGGTFVPALDAPGIYTYTVDGGICGNSTAAVEVDVLTSPGAQWGGVYERCPGAVLDLPIEVSGDGPFVLAVALNGNALPPFAFAESNPSFAANAAGTYTLEEISNAQCSGQVGGTVQVIDLPVPISTFTWESMGEDEVTDVLVFTPDYEGPVDGYLWEFFGLSESGSPVQRVGQSTAPTPSFAPIEGNGGNFRACLELRGSNGCSSSHCRDFSLPVRRHFYMPNAFTPNGDGKNDLFHPVMEGYEDFDYHWRIYDRIGQLVFETTDQRGFWNGSQGGSAHYVPAGMYVWSISLRSRGSAASEVRRGHVTVVR